MIYYIILFIILVFLAYIMGITIVTIIDKHLGNIAINLPKQNIVVNIPQDKIEHFTNKIEPNNQKSIEIKQQNIEHVIEPVVEGFDNAFEDKYVLNNVIPDVDIKLNICFENHCHNKCITGRMNYPQPELMSPIDKHYFKYNYQPNFTTQDYVNWLWLYNKSPEELPYIHMKNLYKLHKDKKLDIITPPKGKKLIPQTSEEYYNKIYNSDVVNVNLPLESTPNSYEAYNYNRYPNVITKKK